MLIQNIETTASEATRLNQRKKTNHFTKSRDGGDKKKVLGCRKSIHRTKKG